MKYKIRLPAVLLVVLLLAGVGTLSVQASQTCERVVKRVVEKVVPAHYSKSMIARWRTWGLTHPNYHPPKRRPHMTSEEVLEKVQFDCSVPKFPESGTVDLEQVPSTGELEPIEVAFDLPPVELVTTTPVGGPVPPIITLPGPIGTPGVPGDDVPEPSSWVLLLTGCAGMLLLLLRRRSVASPFASLPSEAI